MAGLEIRSFRDTTDFLIHRAAKGQDIHRYRGDTSLISVRAPPVGWHRLKCGNLNPAVMLVDSTLAKLPCYVRKRVADRKHGFESRSDVAMT